MTKQQLLDRVFDPKLRLFLSADLVGSTAFKSALRSQPAAGGPIRLEDKAPFWLKPISRFFIDIEKWFMHEWLLASDKNEIKFDPGPAPETWKTLGDEILFVKDLTDPYQGWLAVAAMMRALKKFRERGRNSGIDLVAQGAAWLAGFPISNSEIAFSAMPQQNEGEIDPHISSLLLNYRRLLRYYEAKEADPLAANPILRDFVGPSIDCGFRLANKSTPERFMLSAELTWLLGKTESHHKSPFSKFPLRYGGLKSMRGVIAGRPYPVYWLETMMGDDFATAEDELLNPHGARNWDLVTKHAGYFIDREKSLHHPHVAGNSAGFNQMPEHLKLAVRQLRDTFIRENDLFESGQRDLATRKP